jgi:hypothetical protein
MDDKVLSRDIVAAFFNRVMLNSAPRAMAKHTKKGNKIKI